MLEIFKDMIILNPESKRCNCPCADESFESNYWAASSEIGDCIPGLPPFCAHRANARKGGGAAGAEHVHSLVTEVYLSNGLETGLTPGPLNLLRERVIGPHHLP